jgi:hypothetical protein
MNIINKQWFSFSTTTTTIHGDDHPRRPPTNTTFGDHRLTPRTTAAHINNNDNVATPRHQPKGRRTTAEGDNLACSLMCHVVQTVATQVIVTVHISPGAQHDHSPSPSPFFTQQAGAMSLSAAWQPTMTEQGHNNEGQHPGKKHTLPPPLLFSPKQRATPPSVTWQPNHKPTVTRR